MTVPEQLRVVWKRLLTCKRRGSAQSSSGLRQQLQGERRRRRQDAAKHLAAGDAKAAEQELKWVALADALLKDTEQHRSRLTATLIFALGCLLALSIGLAWRPGPVPVVLELQATDIELTLDRPWGTEDLDLTVDTVDFGNFQQLRAPGGGISAKSLSARLESLSLAKPSVILRSLAVSGSDQGGPVSLRLWWQDELYLAVFAGRLTGIVQADNARLVVDPGQDSEQVTRVDGNRPEFFEIDGVGGAQNPTELVLAPRAGWDLKGLVVTRLQLRRDAPNGAGLESSLLGGDVHLRDTDRTLKLHPGDWLKLGRLDTERLSVEVVPAAGQDAANFRLRFVGKVARIETGPDRDNLPSRAPSLLEYLVHQQTLALVWGSVVFLWGLFVGLRAWLGLARLG
jgi:hypothetical protein